MRHFGCNHRDSLRASFMGRGPFGPWGGRGGRPPRDGFEGRRGHGHGGPGMDEMNFKRILGHGDLRFVILSLLEKQPSHGYELIKAVEERSSGHYVPSPGVIYPTLTFLQEGGYATVSSEQGKNLYTITEAGVAMLNENRENVDAIFERMDFMSEKISKLQEWFGREEMRSHRSKHESGPIHTAFHKLRETLSKHMPMSDEDQRSIAEIIEKAAEEIRKMKSGK